MSALGVSAEITLIPERVLRVRAERAISLRQAAREIGMSHAQLHLIETGDVQNMRITTLMRVLSWLEAQ